MCNANSYNKKALIILFFSLLTKTILTGNQNLCRKPDYSIVLLLVVMSYNFYAKFLERVTHFLKCFHLELTVQPVQCFEKNITANESFSSNTSRHVEQFIAKIGMITKLIYYVVEGLRRCLIRICIMPPVFK